ncbi:hypothetical protein FT663_01411 [Candidozyma haemuli var. vulneris]|uniref:Protein HIR n=1 Tax=Candidozyma haemuli TaxID=45357 RepID=A0A2V1AYV4_9ASCO|nr:hypothetical protein CXQ85_002747 [[Candida] haemuloni]KAF3992546.1 hypothetical protein FT662_01092 [[Candida] haemuloni var. vulneris]KAF3994498.1 hypothetical protein FT663_01411 [[Candida] haemuloni var. vulneris]PVH23022.1 hypothetical protein CXQ85_002747 [[Candida] haemuloni]
MKLLVLPQLLHGGEVHSVDIDVSSKYVATAGNDSDICIWDFASLSNIETASEEDVSKIEPVQVVKAHEHAVRVARWSKTEPTYLASGDVSGNIYLTNMADMSHKLLYPWPSVKNENNEVADIAWSADSRLLAWSTSDGRVHIYDLSKDTYQLLNEASGGNNKGKTTAQKSLAFNHSNSNLVTMGVDTFLHVYQYRYDSADNYQFKLTNKISKLMNNNPTTTVTINYERISWSSDDEFFSVPSASKQHTSLITLLSRSQDWENKVSLVGHDVDCDVVKFGPHIFQAKEESSDPDAINIYHIIASAGSDKTLALWNTTKETPIAVLREVSEKPIVDICWDNSGSHLVLGSLDGHLTIVKFEPLELGETISGDTLQKLKDTQTAYLKSFAPKEAESTKRGQKSGADLIDQKDSKKLADAFAGPKEKKSEDVSDGTVNAKDTTQDSTDNTEVHGDIHPEVLSSNTPGQIDDIMSTAMGERTKPSSSATSKSKPSSGKVTPKPVPATSITNQKTSTKNGKKRIQPMLISNGNGPTSKSSTLTKTSNGDGEARASSSKSLMEFDRPSYNVSEEAFKDSKRNRAHEDGGPTKKIRRELEPVKFVGTAVLNPNTAFAKIRLSIPKVRMSFQLPCRSDEKMLLDIRNGQGNENAPSRITCYKNEQPVWTDFIPRFLQLATEGSSFWAVCTADGQIITYSHLSGKRFLPPIVLGSPIVFLESHGDYLMTVTAVGELYVWDMKLKKLHLHSPSSLASILDSHSKFHEDTLSKSENITMCSITSKGIPLVTLSNGSGFLFNSDMGVWQTITEAWWAFGSHYWDSIGDEKHSSETQTSNLSESGKNSSILSLLEHKTNEEIIRKSRVGRGKYFNKISKNLIMKEGFENLENTISLSHLENRILCCELLGEFKDFHDFLITYCKRICELGLKAKLFEFCEKLLGDQSESGSDEESQICGYDRKELLKEVIFACAHNRDAQRVLQYFSKQLGLIEDDY